MTNGDGWPWLILTGIGVVVLFLSLFAADGITYHSMRGEAVQVAKSYAIGILGALSGIALIAAGLFMNFRSNQS
jgi:uncharacterized membrane protein